MQSITQIIRIVLTLLSFFLLFAFQSFSFAQDDSALADEDESTDQASKALIDVNSANKEKLQELPGIGPVKSQRIVEYREKNGPFKSKEELIEVKGIGPKTVEKIKPFIKIEIPSAIQKRTETLYLGKAKDNKLNGISYEFRPLLFRKEISIPKIKPKPFVLLSVSIDSQMYQFFASLAKEQGRSLERTIYLILRAYFLENRNKCIERRSR